MTEIETLTLIKDIVGSAFILTVSLGVLIAIFGKK